MYLRGAAICGVTMRTILYRVTTRIECDPTGNSRSVVEVPPEILGTLGLEDGSVVELQIRPEDGGLRLVLEPIHCPGTCTVVADRYGGGYSGGQYVAWPLPEAAIPPDSQGGDIDAGFFWSKPHLCGLGATPAEARADLERRLSSTESDPPVLTDSCE